MNVTSDFFRQLTIMRPDLLRFARFRLQDDALAEDAVQDALIAVLEHPGRFSGMSSLRTYVTGILKFKIIDSQRSRSRARVGSRCEYDGDSSEEIREARLGAATRSSDLAPQSYNPENCHSEAEFFTMLERCLGKFPLKTAEVFVMRECVGLETDEICKELKITPANVWLLLCRARRALRMSPELISRTAVERMQLQHSLAG